MAVRNAVLTAEGAIYEAMKRSPGQLSGISSLVLGYGRCGRVLAQRLKGLNVRVTVAARKEVARVQAVSDGIEAIALTELTKHAGGFSLIYNTIPAPVLGKEVIRKLNRRCLILDLASRPGGTDFEEAVKAGIQAVLLPGIPGKYAPESAGEILADFVKRKVLEGELDEDRG